MNEQELDDLYQELIIEHAKAPRSYGALPNADVSLGLFNPLCGDEVQLSINFQDQLIDEIRFSGHGCAISQASASMMTELLHGKNIDEGLELCALYRRMLKNEAHDDTLVPLGDLTALKGVRKFSARIKCAMLAWEALEQALNKRKSH